MPEGAEQQVGTDRRTKERRRSSDPRLRAIVERLADGVVIVGHDGCIRFVNPAAEALFGRPASKLIGEELGFPVLVGENAEVEVVRPGGATVTAELRVVEIDWEGEPARLASLRDVTDRKRAEEQVWMLEHELAARAQAEAANQAKSDFLAVMSHELRTPLNAVLGYAELLDLGIAGPLTAEQRKQIARIRGSGRHLLSLVNEVLDLSKIESGRLSVQTVPVRSGTTADAALGLVQPIADSRGIQLGGEPLGDGDAVFVGDEDRVRQILVNLLTNAVKFTRPGGRVWLECGTAHTPEPDARLHGRGPWVFLQVRDTGIGIPPDRLPEIFEPFTQVSTGHTRLVDGSGLGLTISRRLARMMRGDLTAKSTAGVGSTFTLWLPAAATQSSSPAWDRDVETPGRLRGVADVGEHLLRDMDHLLESFVSRMRTEQTIPWATSLRFSQLADHYAPYLADIASSLIIVAEAEGHPSTLLADGTDIQRLVAERHGAQRAQLGWTEEALRREYTVVREEVERVVRRRERDLGSRTVEESLVLLDRFFSQAEELSVRAFRRTID